MRTPTSSGGAVGPSVTHGSEDFYVMDACSILRADRFTNSRAGINSHLERSLEGSQKTLSAFRRISRPPNDRLWGAKPPSVFARSAGHEIRPVRHHWLALVEIVRASIGRFDFVCDRMGQCCLCDLAWIVRLFRNPIAKR